MCFFASTPPPVDSTSTTTHIEEKILGELNFGTEGLMVVLINLLKVHKCSSFPEPPKGSFSQEFHKISTVGKITLTQKLFLIDFYVKKVIHNFFVTAPKMLQ